MKNYTPDGIVPLNLLILMEDLSWEMYMLKKLNRMHKRGKIK